VDPYLYSPLRLHRVHTDNSSFALRFLQVAHALTTAAATVDQTREPCCGPPRGPVSSEVRADDLLRCVETLRCARRNNRWETSKVLRTETHGRQNRYSSASLYAACGERRQGDGSSRDTQLGLFI